MHYLNQYQPLPKFKTYLYTSKPFVVNHPSFKGGNDINDETLINKRFSMVFSDPYAKNDDGAYLFHELIAMNDITSVSYLLSKPKRRDALMGLKNEFGKGALFYATSPEMQNILKTKGGAKVEDSQPIEDAITASNRNMVENLGQMSFFNAFEEVSEQEPLIKDEQNVTDSKEQSGNQMFEAVSTEPEHAQVPTVVSQENTSIQTDNKTDTDENNVNLKPNASKQNIKMPDQYKNYSQYKVNPDIKSLDDIIGFENAKRELSENIIIPLSQDSSVLNDLNLLNGILLEGTDGVSSVISALVNETGLPTLQIHSMQELVPIIKDVEANFKKDGTRTIVVATNFDDFYDKEHAYGEKTAKNQFETILKNCSQKGLLFVATTKDKSMISDNFIRAGLLDKVLTLPTLSENERQKFIEQKINDTKVLNILINDIEELTKSTEGIPLAEIEKILDETARTAISREEYIELLPIYKEQLAEYTSEKGLVPIDEFNRTAAYDTPEFKRTPITADDPTIDDLGGMPDIKKRLNELYIEPMKKLDDLIAELGINDALPDGTIFYGDPGNGKTYTAKALAKTLGLPFYETKLSDIGTALVHEEGKAFKKRADQLNRKFKETGERSVWFLDEFESLGGERGNNAQHNKELTDALLQELNNPAGRGFILIAATNDLDGVDAALKRRGRLGNWICFNNPTFEERCDVIKRTLAKSASTEKFASDEQFVKEIATDFDGMSMACITSVLKDAKRQTILNGSDFKDAIEECKAINNERMMGEFCNKTGLKQHKYNEWDFQTLDELGGMQDVKRQLQESVIDVWDPEIRATLIANKRHLPGGVILFGPPGTGKTTIIETLARQMNVPLYKMDYSSINDSQYIHQIAKHVSEIFERLALEAKIQKKPVMLFFDEAERFFPNHAERHQIEEVNTYKDLMNKAAEKGIILVGATNYIDKVNPEITGNPRRMGTKIEVDNPNEDDRYNLFQKSLLSLPIIAGVLTATHCKDLAKITEGWSIGQITDTIDKVITQAVKKKENITFEIFENAFKTRII